MSVGVAYGSAGECVVWRCHFHLWFTGWGWTDHSLGSVYVFGDGVGWGSPGLHLEHWKLWHIQFTHTCWAVRSHTHTGSWGVLYTHILSEVTNQACRDLSAPDTWGSTTGGWLQLVNSRDLISCCCICVRLARAESGGERDRRDSLCLLGEWIHINSVQHSVSHCNGDRSMQNDMYCWCPFINSSVLLCFTDQCSVFFFYNHFITIKKISHYL